MTKAKTYTEKRTAENREDCRSCHVTDAACTEMVLKRGRACCSTCSYTDTHPKRGQPHDGEPCVRCGGSGIEPAAD